jgi:hypothetical protein
MDESPGRLIARLHQPLCNKAPAKDCTCEYCLLAHTGQECVCHHGAFNWACTAPPGSG